MLRRGNATRLVGFATAVQVSKYPSNHSHSTVQCEQRRSMFGDMQSLQRTANMWLRKADRAAVAIGAKKDARANLWPPTEVDWSQSETNPVNIEVTLPKLPSTVRASEFEVRLTDGGHVLRVYAVQARRMKPLATWTLYRPVQLRDDESGYRVPATKEDQRIVWKVNTDSRPVLLLSKSSDLLVHRDPGAWKEEWPCLFKLSMEDLEDSGALLSPTDFDSLLQKQFPPLPKTDSSARLNLTPAQQEEVAESDFIDSHFTKMLAEAKQAQQQDPGEESDPVTKNVSKIRAKTASLGLATSKELQEVRSRPFTWSQYVHFNSLHIRRGRLLGDDDIGDVTFAREEERSAATESLLQLALHDVKREETVENGLRLLKALAVERSHMEAAVHLYHALSNNPRHQPTGAHFVWERALGTSSSSELPTNQEDGMKKSRMEEDADVNSFVGDLHEVGHPSFPPLVAPATYCWQRATLNGDSTAIPKVAKALLDGQLKPLDASWMERGAVPRPEVDATNKEKGLRWLALAERTRSPLAFYIRSQLYKTGSHGFPQSDGKALFWANKCYNASPATLMAVIDMEAALERLDLRDQEEDLTRSTGSDQPMASPPEGADDKHCGDQYMF